MKKRINMKTILTVGVYDLIHVGHVELFRRARALGDRLMVAVQDEKFIAAYKPGAKTACSTEERCYMVKAIRYVDDVLIYQRVDDLIKQVDFDVFVKGPDQNHAGFQAAVRWCKDHGKEVVTLPRTEGVSSSWLKETIRNRS